MGYHLIDTPRRTTPGGLRYRVVRPPSVGEELDRFLYERGLDPGEDDDTPDDPVTRHRDNAAK